jgi:hypothetical protein
MPEADLLMEIGHLLDLCGFGTYGLWSSEVEMLFEPWREATRGTRLLAHLRELHTNPAGRTVAQRHLVSETAAYLIRERELWSRSYFQYIARHSPQRRLRAQVEAMRPGPSTGIMIPLVWADDDFEPIDAAIDNLLARVGWRPCV